MTLKENRRLVYGVLVAGAAVWTYYVLQPDRVESILTNSAKMCGQPVKIRGVVVAPDDPQYSREFHVYRVSDGYDLSMGVKSKTEKLPDIGQPVSVTGVWDCSRTHLQETSRY